MAAIRDDAEACYLLARAGADVDAFPPPSTLYIKGNATNGSIKTCSPLLVLGSWNAGSSELVLEWMSFLVKVDINCVDAEGDTRPMAGITINKIAVVAHLLHRGADPSLINKHRQSALHLAARFGSQAGLEELVELGVFFRGLDVNARSAEGKTPQDYFDGREPAPLEGLRRAWEHFLEAVKGVVDDSDEEKSVDEFVDAREEYEAD